MAFPAFSVGQSADEPILVDEYSHVAPCDDLLSRLDAYLNELRLNPDQSGLIVLRDTPERRSQVAILQALFESWMDFRTFDRRRVEFVRADANEHLRQFWRVPPGATKPEVENVVSGYQMSGAVTKPFLLADETPTHICPEIDDFGIFARFLSDNPTARGNIVVRDQSSSRARRRAAAIIRKFERNFGIQRKRLRIFTAKFKRPSKYDKAIVEYWYLP